MSFYDPVSIYTVTADENGSSNALIGTPTNATGVLIHKVAMRNTGAQSSNVVSVLINDHATIASSATLIALSTNTTGAAAGASAFEAYMSETYDPPVRFTSGLSFNVTGAGVSVSIFYTRD